MISAMQPLPRCGQSCEATWFDVGVPPGGGVVPVVCVGGGVVVVCVGGVAGGVAGGFPVRTPSPNRRINSSVVLPSSAGGGTTTSGGGAGWINPVARS